MTRFTSIVAAILFALPASFSVLAIALALMATPAKAGEHASVPAGSVAEPAPTLGEAAFTTLAATLRPGDFQWAAEPLADGPLLIAVSIADQKLYAYRNGALIAVSTVSTGKRGHATPTGVFPILEKDREHYSSKYDNAPMPFMQRLTWDGVALHAGKLPGYPASHGCVRLPLAFAEQLFGVTDRGGLVIITERSLAERAMPDASFDLAIATSPALGRPDILTLADPVSPNAVAALLGTPAPSSRIIG